MSVTSEELSAMCRRALQDKDAYWAEIAQKLLWTKKWTSVSDTSEYPFTKWFVGGELSISANCLDRHVEAGLGQMEIIVFQSLVTGRRQSYTYAHILDQVSRLAGVLSSLGVKKGDTVLIYMPMSIEGIYAMHACARLGAVNVALPSGLPVQDLVTKIDHCQPKVMIMSSYGYHADGWKSYKSIVDEACLKAECQPQKILVFSRPDMERCSLVSGRDLDWAEQMASSAAVPAPCVSMEANDPLFMFYTSGSTGNPKAIVHSVASSAVRYLHDTQNNFSSKDEGIVFFTSNFCWLVFSNPLAKMPAMLLEGDCLLTSDVRNVYRLLSENRITYCFMRPGIWKTLKGMDPDGKISSEFNFERLQTIYAGGERTDMKTMEWVARNLKAHVYNVGGQTETNGFIFGFPDKDMQDIYPRRVFDFGKPTPGWDVYLMNQDGQQAKPGELGRILIRLPLPPGIMLSLYGSKELCLENYYNQYPGFFDTKDEGVMDDLGKLRIEGRTDDIMKCGLVYLAAQAVEELIMKHESVSECLVVSITDLVWKEIPVALYTRGSASNQSPEEISRELQRMVSEHFGASVKFGGAISVCELPRTRTGKAHRPSCSALARGKHFQGLGALENPQVLAEIAQALKAANLGNNVLTD